jgi:alpha-L-rhamnosidase
MIAASGRILVQRDWLFPRHSHAYVMQHPTWPVEWLQITPFLAWQDFMATGQVDLALAFEDKLHDNTKISFLENATGVLRTDKMGSHITDWMPNADESDQTVARGENSASNHLAVCNGWAAAGLDRLAQMVARGGRASAAQYAAESAALAAAMNTLMWNASAGLWCDGICSEVGGNTRIMASLFLTGTFGLTQALHGIEGVDAAWKLVSDWGMEQIGDYGAFFYQGLIASSYYAPYYEGPDDGTAMLTALTKCDTDSWCSGLRDDNLTMTRESWHDGTFSHGWGSSAIVGVSWGIMGVHETAPGWASFIVKPKLATLTSATIRVPTIRGYINVTAAPSLVTVDVPCNTAATLCTPRSSSDGAAAPSAATHALLLNGVEQVDAVFTRAGHACVARSLGCAAAGGSWTLRLEPRAAAPATAPALRGAVPPRSA